MSSSPSSEQSQKHDVRREADVDQLPDSALIDALQARIDRLERENEQLARNQGAPRPIVQALIESETRFRTILESEPACVKLVAEDGSLISMNPAGLEMVEAQSEEEVLGISVFDLVRSHDRASFMDMHERIFRGESAHLEFEIEGLKGTLRTMETFAAPLADEGGEIIAQLAVTHDITQRKNEHLELAAYRERLEGLVAERTRELEVSREEARRVERLASLGTLAAGLAHELNNPLGTILLGADLLRVEEDPARREQTLDGIRQDVARCSHIVKSMLRFGRDEVSKKDPISINQVVRIARDNSRKLIAQNAIRLQLDLTPDLPPLIGNATELGQVFLNLIQNAIHASDQGGVVTISSTLSEGRVECRIEDSGCGMPSDIQDRARDPFFTTRQNEGGTGLGLSVSHGIVTDHRGTLTIESQPNQGTIVCVSIPIAD